MASAKVAKVKRTPKEPLPLEDKCKDFDVLTTLGEIFCLYPNKRLISVKSFHHLLSSRIFVFRKFVFCRTDDILFIININCL